MKTFASYLVFFFLALLAFGGLLAAPFFYDDVVVTRDNRLLQSSEGLQEIWRGHVDHRREMNGSYRPLLLTALSAEGRAVGFRPEGFRLLVLALHAFNALLLLILARNLAALPEIASWLVALVFLLHPLQATGLALVWKQSDLWVALGALASLLLWRRHFLWALLLFFVTLGFKESAVILPLFWLATEPLQPRERRTARLATVTCGLLLSLIYYRSLGSLMQAPAVSGDGFPGGRFDYFLTQLAVLPLYLKNLLLPTSLTIDRGIPMAGEVTPFHLVSILALVSVSGWILWRTFRGSRGGLMLLLATLWLVPTSSFHPLSLLYDETRMYLVVGFLVAAVAVWGGAFLARIPVRPPLAWGAIGAIALSLIWQSSQETSRFRSEENLWEAALRVDPASIRAHYQLGYLARGARALDEAEERFRSALALQPGFAPARLELGIVLGQRGDLDGAAREFTALLSSPPYWAAKGHYHLGLDAIYRKDFPRAKREFASVRELSQPAMAEKGEKFLGEELSRLAGGKPLR